MLPRYRDYEDYISSATSIIVQGFLSSCRSVTVHSAQSAVIPFGVEHVRVFLADEFVRSNGPYGEPSGKDLRMIHRDILKDIVKVVCRYRLGKTYSGSKPTPEEFREGSDDEEADGQDDDERDHPNGVVPVDVSEATVKNHKEDDFGELADDEADGEDEDEDKVVNSEGVLDEAVKAVIPQNVAREQLKMKTPEDSDASPREGQAAPIGRDKSPKWRESQTGGSSSMKIWADAGLDGRRKTSR
ncbi:hypothetical protein IAT40_006368 [Kwoniella sp. CBS 6097]